MCRIKSKKQFSKRGLGDTNIVFNELYRDESNSTMTKEIAKQIKAHRGIRSVIVGHSDGTIEQL